MIADADRAAIEASVDALGVEQWRGLDSEERDRVRRALAPAATTPPTEGTTHVTRGQAA